MAEEVQLPQLGESVTEGIITEWLVAVGDTVEVDQPLVEISTDKVDTEIPSPVAGTVEELKAEVDDTIEVGQVIVVIGTRTGDTPSGTDDDHDEGQASAAATSEQDDSPADGTDTGDRDAAGGAPAGTTAQTTTSAASAASGPRPRGEEHTHDVIVLGGGTGGYSVALRAAQLGLEVALVEQAKVGGTCLHWGCIPTKAILYTAEIAEHAQEADDFGVLLEYEGIEVGALNAHKDAVVERMYKGLQGALKGRGVETVVGTGTLTASDTVTVDTGDGDRQLRAPNVVLATGSTPREMPFAPFDGDKVLSSDHALNLQELPSSAIVLGSGAVGMEFATAWSAFGVDVTIIELEDRLLPLEDADSSKEVGRAFRKRARLEALTGTTMTEVDTSGDGVVCTVDTGSGEAQQLTGDVLLVAVGRGPVTDGLGFEKVGVELDRGFIAVDDHCRTSVQGVWAVGDVIPTLGLAHASFAEGFLVADQLAGLDVVPIDYKGVPRVTYSHPEVASVGLTEAEATDAGHEVVVEKYPFQSLGRAAMMKATGIVKIVAVADDTAAGGAGRVLGIHIVGPRATDLIAEGELIYNWEALPSEVARFIHPHPSLSEAIGEAHLALAGRALHG